MQAFHKAGMPPGTINIVSGRGSEIGDYIVTHPGVNCISFTGGDTGISISKKAGMVPIQMVRPSAGCIAAISRLLVSTFLGQTSAICKSDMF